MDFFGDLEEVVEGTRKTAVPGLTLGPDSTIGLFVRQQLLAFAAMSFEGASRLFRQIQAYIEAYKTAINRQTRHAFVFVLLCLKRRTERFFWSP